MCFPVSTQANQLYKIVILLENDWFWWCSATKSKWTSRAQSVSSLWEVCVRWTTLCPRLTRKESSSCPFATFLAGQKCHGSNQWKNQAPQIEHWLRRLESKAKHDSSKQGFCVSYCWTILCKRGREGLDPNTLLQNQNNYSHGIDIWSSHCNYCQSES